MSHSSRSLVLVALLATLAACGPKAKWQLVEGGDNSFRIEFPGKTRCVPEESSQVCMFRLGKLVFTVVRSPQVLGARPWSSVPPGWTEVPLGEHRGLRTESEDTDPFSFGHRLDVETARFSIVTLVRWEGAADLPEARAEYARHRAEAERFFSSLQVLDPPLR